MGSDKIKQQIGPKKDIYEKELFNFGVYNKQQKDTTASKTPYISFKFIIELINKLQLEQDYDSELEKNMIIYSTINVPCSKNIMATFTKF